MQTLNFLSRRVFFRNDERVISYLSKKHRTWDCPRSKYLPFPLLRSWYKVLRGPLGKRNKFMFSMYVRDTARNLDYFLETSYTSLYFPPISEPCLYFYVFQSFPYFLVLTTWTLLFSAYCWKDVDFYCI